MSSLLDEKIESLFDLRQIPVMLQIARVDRPEEFYKSLVELQKTVYALDKYLEANWEIEYEALDHLWHDIYLTIMDFGVTKRECEVMMRELRRYAKGELDLRKRQMPTRFSMLSTYTVKSCDVHLIRDLVYQRSQWLDKIVKRDTWQVYDLTAELHDDVYDLYEDYDTYNGNRFQISLILRGKEYTRETYLEFIRLLRHMVNRITDEDNSRFARRLQQMARYHLNSARKLMLRRLEQKKCSEVSESKLAVVLH